MSQLTILRYPDLRLHTVAKPVAAVDARVRKLADDMFETMYEAAGIGLAATQVDVHERLITIDVSEERDQPMVLINPEIVWASEETRVGDEGCLSVPGIYDGVERSIAIKVHLPARPSSPASHWSGCTPPASHSPGADAAGPPGGAAA
jgi:peptide deformylase